LWEVVFLLVLFRYIRPNVYYNDVKIYKGNVTIHVFYVMIETISKLIYSLRC
jgi:hypothetical protein